ncbi:MAG TPA: GlsB/YeaQ/YmgE family stress response membrane protein [Patescibacteria group bacterium]|nr:GlsB/YeaQ/YmgE family stress response membrane protein [Patescibacteria group bacterium]
MGILFMVVIGGIAGFIASAIMKSPNSMWTDIVLGIVGALVGGLIMGLVGQSGYTGFNLYSLFVSVIGAIVVIALARIFTGRSVVR